MNILDVVIIATAASAVLGGYSLGFVARAVSWIGLAVGLVVASHFLPGLVRNLQSSTPSTRLLVVLGVLIGSALLGQALGLLAGSALRRTLPLGPLWQVDRIAGAVAGVVGVLVAVWLVLPSMVDVPGWPAQQVRTSRVAHAVDDLFPNPPNALQALRRLVGPGGFPQVFSDLLHRGEATGPPPATPGMSTVVENRVAASTVKVEGIACNRIQDGSGFAASPDTVVTNAHVVAGERTTTIIRPDGARLKATVAVFDPNRDLALLHVTGLGEEPLPVGTAAAGAVGAVFGHPRGQAALAVTPAAIRQNIVAVGRDLYDQHETRRQVFVLASDLQPGDSGGALVDHTGTVVGVAFAIAPDRPGTSYALTTAELRPVLALGSDGRASTGQCLSDI